MWPIVVLILETWNKVIMSAGCKTSVICHIHEKAVNWSVIAIAVSLC